MAWHIRHLATEYVDVGRYIRDQGLAILSFAKPIVWKLNSLAVDGAGAGVGVLHVCR
jgi:hypothetical protein